MNNHLFNRVQAEMAQFVVKPSPFGTHRSSVVLAADKEARSPIGMHHYIASNGALRQEYLAPSSEHARVAFEMDICRALSLANTMFCNATVDMVISTASALYEAFDQQEVAFEDAPHYVQDAFLQVVYLMICLPDSDSAACGMAFASGFFKHGAADKEYAQYITADTVNVSREVRDKWVLMFRLCRALVPNILARTFEYTPRG